MRTSVIGTSVLMLVGVIGAATLSRAAVAQRSDSHLLVTQAEYERWQTELSNWGRWGKDDEMGTLNLITPAKRNAAAALVRDGITVSLASNASTEKGVDVPCPVEWAMLTASQTGATDRIGYPCIHGAGSEAAAARNRWEFMLTIAPLPIPRGTGSPVNPIAVF